MTIWHLWVDLVMRKSIKRLKSLIKMENLHQSRKQKHIELIFKALEQRSKATRHINKILQKIEGLKEMKATIVSMFLRILFWIPRWLRLPRAWKRKELNPVISNILLMSLIMMMSLLNLLNLKKVETETRAELLIINQLSN